MSDVQPRQPLILPISTIQHDFQDIIKEISDGVVPDETFWVSCYKYREPSVHGKAHASLDEQNRELINLEGRDGVLISSYGKHTYSISCPSLEIEQTRIAAPTTSYSHPAAALRPRKITAFDVAPDGSQFVTGYHDGTVHIRPTSSLNGMPSAISHAHLSTVVSLRFFPSSRVVLTSGVDFSLSILPAEPPETPVYATAKVVPARVLRGHTRTVTSTGIIARGRNVLSGSKDGTLRLWDIPSGAQIRSLAAGSNHFVPILAISAGKHWEADDSLQSADGSADPREVDTSDKVVFCALQDGSFELFDLRSKHAFFRSPVGTSGARSALQTIAYSPEYHLVATGSASGLVSLYDTRTLGAGPTITFRRNEAPVEDLAYVTLSDASFSLGPTTESNTSGSKLGLAIATEDGLPYVAELQPSGPRVRAELVGTDCDAVRFVGSVDGDVWSASDDGVVRHYKP